MATVYTRRDSQRKESSHRAHRAQELFAQRMTAAEAAKVLGVSRMTLYRDLERWSGATGESWQPGKGTPAISPVESVERDPLLDGWEPESVTPVTDSDIDDLLA